jgi:2-dehydro-3-deoxyphosphogluconate aldolase/(4S)-4-hydroxy-2-oxoglutarate aldolase
MEDETHPLFDLETARRVRATGVVAVLVIDDLPAAVPLARALLAGGIDVMELTLRTPVALEAIRVIRDEVPDMLVGAGTVLNAAQVGAVAAAGAAFAVSPGVNPAVLEQARQTGLSFAPGVMTPSDVEAALGHGCRLLKFFPAGSSGGLPHLKNIAAPYQHLGVEYIPLGGLNAENMAGYLAFGAVAAIGGSWLARRDVVAAGDWAAVTAAAEQARRVARAARETAA